MSILIDQTKRVLVQGITGREGMARTKLMREYGTNVVAGVTPGKGGQEVEGVPVFDTIQEAWEKAGPIDVSVLFIPAPIVKSAALEAIAAGVKLLVIVPDRVPIWDVLAIAKAAKEAGAQFRRAEHPGRAQPRQGRAGHDRRAGGLGPVVVLPRPGGRHLAQRGHDLQHGLLPGPGGHRRHDAGPRRRRRRDRPAPPRGRSSSSSRTPRPRPSSCSARSAAARRSGWPT